MKFTGIMRNLSVALFLLISGSFSFAQSTANSPYSSFGLGELGGLDHSVFGGIGNSLISMQDSSVVNFYNPSSYSSLGTGQPLFSLGFSSRFSTFTENGNTSFYPLAGIQHFVIGIPFAKRFGLALGLKPYSRRGYEFTERFPIDDDSLYYNYSGSGSINDVFLGFSTDILKLPKTRLSLGVQGGFLFGTVSNTRKSGLIVSSLGSNNYAGGIGMKSFRARSFHYEFGLSYEQKLTEKQRIGLYVAVDPLQKINGTYLDELYYSSDINDPRIYDTLRYNDSLTGNLTNVPAYNIGFKYQLNWKAHENEVKEINSEISFHVGFTYSDWSKYADRFDPNFVNNFESSMKYSLGVQYIPETDFIANIAKTKYYNRMRYRIGGYYQTLPYRTNNEQVKDFGITFGLGFPIANQHTLSSVNIGFSYGSRGVSDGQALKEKYFGVNLGLLIGPTNADRWFRKRKLN